MVIFHTIYVILVFSPFSSFVRFGPFRNCSRAIIVFLKKNCLENMHYTAQTGKFQCDPSLTTLPWMAFNLNVLTVSLGWYLEVSQVRSTLVH